MNKFTPTIELTKTGDTLSKVRDSVDYTITLDNASPEGPDIECTITDEKLGVSEVRTLAWDDPAYVIQKSHTVLPSDPVSLVNEVTATCTFVGEVDERASDSVERTTDPFQPAITLEKTVDACSKIGDSTDYTITLTNTSSAGTPDLTCTISDAALGVSETVTLAAGAPATVSIRSR